MLKSIKKKPQTTLDFLYKNLSIVIFSRGATFSLLSNKKKRLLINNEQIIISFKKHGKQLLNKTNF